MTEALLDPAIQKVLYTYAKRIATLEAAITVLWDATEGDSGFDGYNLSGDAYNALLALGAVLDAGLGNANA